MTHQIRLFSASRTCSLMVAAALLAGGCGGSGPAAPTPPPPVNVPFTVTDLRVGTGEETAVGKRLTVDYVGWLYDQTAPEQKGQVFDTSLVRDPFTFTLGAGQVIQGWEQGFDGMRVGGVRRFVIPPDLAYGASGVPGVIPANATVIFEVELLAVEDPS
jgi:FKBP-type peptidyl-prolyl cis-trans isomerase FkpA